MVTESKPPFCNAPFVQLMLKPSGDIAPCCYKYAHDLGDIKQQSLLEIWNGDRIKKLRREFLSGQVKTCKKQIAHIACNERFARFADIIERNEHQSSAPRRLDLRLNSQCNLSCVMCDVWTGDNKQYDEANFWTEGPSTLFPHLLEVDLLGGEPFIQRDTYRLIEQVTAVNPGCQWSFVTNGHYQFCGRIRRYLDLINIRTFQVSVDSLDSNTYAAIRRKGNLETVKTFISDLVAYRSARAAEDRDFGLVFSMCVLKRNWDEIPNFLRFCRENGAVPDLQYAFYDPSEENSLAFTTLEQKEHIVTMLLSNTKPSDQPWLAPILKPLQNSIKRGRERAQTLES
ncbi:MAG: SPASM domain-containing protein [Oligoflexales bacterium]